MQDKRFFKQEIHHVFNKSIAGFGIFKDFQNGHRFLKTTDYYNDALAQFSYSKFLRIQAQTVSSDILISKSNPLVKFISYCIMPDHYHFLIKIIRSDINFSKYISDVENSFTRYFNIRFNRKGPLWQSRFKSARIKTNEQLLHVSRYIHLNPTTSHLVEKPEEWKLSSYKQFIYDKLILSEIITEISIEDRIIYRKFVENQKDYQRKLKKIKKLLLD